VSAGALNHLSEIILTLKESGVDFIVCGGVALVVQGVERLTMDIDLSVELSRGNLEKFLSVMNKLRLKPRAPVPAESLLDPETRKMFVEEKHALVFTFIDLENPFRQVDVFIADSLSYDTLKDDSEIFDIENQPVRVLSRQKLLALKQAIDPPREKDLFDIRMLKKLLSAHEDET